MGLIIGFLAGNSEVSAFALCSQLIEQVGDPLSALGGAVTAHMEQCLLLEAVTCTPLHKSNELKEKENTCLNSIIILKKGAVICLWPTSEP